MEGTGEGCGFFCSPKLHYLSTNFVNNNFVADCRLPLSMTKYVFFPSLFCSEYVKIMDGSGATVLIRYGYSSTPQKPFREVNFGNSDNISVQVYLYGSYSNVRLQFGIVQQGLQSG